MNRNSIYEKINLTILTSGFLLFSSIFVLLAFIIISINTAENPHLFLAGGAAISAFLFTASVKLHSECRDRAYSLISDSKKDERTRKAINNSTRYLKNIKNPCKKSAIEVYTHFVKGTDQKCKKRLQEILFSLNFFEELALGIEYKEVYEPLLREYYDVMFHELYEHAERTHFLDVIIEHNTSDQRKTKAYYYCKSLYERWYGKNKPLSKQRIPVLLMTLFLVILFGYTNRVGKVEGPLKSKGTSNINLYLQIFETDPADVIEMQQITDQLFTQGTFVNVRSAPSKKSRIIHNFPKQGEVIQAIKKVGEQRDWIQIRLDDGSVGYIFSDLVQTKRH